MTRVAAVDLGTNSTRLLVADVAEGRVEEIVRRLRITRLGEGVDATHHLLPRAIARVSNCLDDYRRELEALGAERTLCLATSAVRDADNGEAFLGEIERSYGFVTRLLSGDDEALLTFRGVTAGRSLGAATLIVDIGGGSTELIVGSGDTVTSHASLDLGCVRLTERFIRTDPPTGDELDECARHVRSSLPDLSVRDAVGVAGTVTSLAALDLGLLDYDPDRIHGHRLSMEAVERQLLRLAALPLAERRRVPGLDPDRAPVIVAGAVILREALAAFGLPALQTSEHDILHGAALAGAELPAAAAGTVPPGARSGG